MTAWLEDNDLEELLLQRYCSDTASAEETARIEAWFRKHQDQRVWYEQFKAELRKQNYCPPSEAHLNARLAEFVRTALQLHPAYTGEQEHVVLAGRDIANVTHRTVPERLGQRPGTGPQTFRIAGEKEEGFSGRTLRMGLWSFVATATVALALIVLAVFPHTQHHPTNAFTTYVTQSGERANIVLLDGTKVSLNVASRIDIPKDFGGHHRSVLLHGEAYFQVAHTTGAPFTVDAGQTHTRVLGTEFSVRAYEPADVQVAVRTGKVAMNNVVLSANDIGHMTRTGRLIVAQHQPLDTALGFVTGRLVLPRMLLRDAIPQLDRWYGADVRLGDPTLGALPIQGTLLSGTIGDLMGLLQGTLDVRVVRHGRMLTLTPL